MAKLCMTQREIKRRKTVDKFKARRDSLIEIINDSKATNEQKFEARKKITSSPKKC
jgi:small subunit ribosomal protein S14